MDAARLPPWQAERRLMVNAALAAIRRAKCKLPRRRERTPSIYASECDQTPKAEALHAATSSIRVGSSLPVPGFVHAPGHQPHA